MPIPSRLLVAAAAVCLVGCATPHLSKPGKHGPHCAAIQSAATISFSSDRSAALARIAASPGLTEHEQLYLVDATVDAGGFSGDIASVLVALARNPGLTGAARARIAERQARAGLFSSDDRRVAEALAASADGH